VAGGLLKYSEAPGSLAIFPSRIVIPVAFVADTNTLFFINPAPPA
jgi:hypothetical protein